MFDKWFHGDGLRPVARGAAVAAVLGLATATTPLVLASPAQATTTMGGCSVTPYNPTFAGFNSAGERLVRFSINVNCAAGRTVYTYQELWEDDGAVDQYEGWSNFEWTLVNPGSTDWGWTLVLPDTEAGHEEMYQRVRFAVCASGVCSSWTNWEYSGITSMPN